VPTTIAELRLKAGLTQEAVARTADLGVRHFQRIESGQTRPLLDTARRIAEALGVHIEDIDWGDGHA
jgi:DNA-binding XRE family transcriptional regulator